MRRFNSSSALAALLLAASCIVPSVASAQANPAATSQAMPFLEEAGRSDVFEITTSQIALMKSQDAHVREFATGMIRDHTGTTNASLAAAKKAGIMAPPPVLNEAQRAQITALLAASGTQFDQLYWQQQLPAHQAALQLMQGYASGGDTPQLRAVATAAVPIVQGHLEHVRMALPAS